MILPPMQRTFVSECGTANPAQNGSTDRRLSAIDPVGVSALHIPRHPRRFHAPRVLH